ncbi:Apoptosis facilitator Bcl-2-like protein 14 [Varanus komodoensis]|nr:Apoptosis facilitator Bcl-2-like protein 14 [Varanus komodoensis]
MNLANFSSMEEIPLEDVDRTSMEYRVLMAYVQCRLSATKYRQLLEGEVKGQEGSAVGREDVEVASPEGLSSEGHEQPSRRGTRKKKKNKKRSNWKHFLLPSCLRPQAEGKPQKIIASNEDAVNGHVLMPQGGVGSVPASLPNVQDDSDITVVADRLAEIVDNSKFYLERTGKRLLECTVSLEEDGGGASKIVYEGSDGKGNHIDFSTKELLCISDTVP